MCIVLIVASLGMAVARAGDVSRDEAFAQAKNDDEQALVDRPLYVTPAPKKFRPRGKGELIVMKLTLEKTTIRRGTPIRCRLEIANVGSVPYVFIEHSQSFFKTGRLPSDALNMSVKGPRGKESFARSKFPGNSDIAAEIHLPAGLTEAEKAAMVESMKRDKRSTTTLFQRLAPGETLHTRGDTAPNGFRTFDIGSWLNSDGDYELYMVLDAFSKSERKSNRVHLKVVP